MSNKLQTDRRSPVGIAALLLCCSALGASAATSAQSRASSFLTGLTITYDHMQTNVPKGIGWSIAGLTAGWALLFRRRPHQTSRPLAKYPQALPAT